MLEDGPLSQTKISKETSDGREQFNYLRYLLENNTFDKGIFSNSNIMDLEVLVVDVMREFYTLDGSSINCSCFQYPISQYNLINYEDHLYMIVGFLEHYVSRGFIYRAADYLNEESGSKVIDLDTYLFKLLK